MSGELIVRAEYSERDAVVYLSGEIDIYNAQQFKEKIYQVVENSKGDVSIDCSDLNYIDSTGLGVFVGALKKAKQNNRDIHILNIRDNIKKLFVITGLDKLFIIH
ncbi:MAG TPA: STAS domain-containing protein [Clostridiales bacterium]|nr:STAS domain-containing protein [Clostridiales bacterium]HPV02779.1 STAS domain-containing protein [Clostridiales bacterium]